MAKEQAVADEAGQVRPARFHWWPRDVFLKGMAEVTAAIQKDPALVPVMYTDLDERGYERVWICARDYRRKRGKDDGQADENGMGYDVVAFDFSNPCPPFCPKPPNGGVEAA